MIYTDLAMMAGVASTLRGVRQGSASAASVLEYKFGGRDISQVLGMSVREAQQFFGEGEARTPAAHAILDVLADVGLGYLSLGQPLTTLSAGERQRLKLATHMAEKSGIYVLDEPTTGLHLADVEQLLGLLDRLVDSGKSVIVIEHSQAAGWPTPTGSSTSARAPGARAVRSSSRASPPTSSRSKTGRASTWRRTSRVLRG